MNYLPIKINASMRVYFASRMGEPDANDCIPWIGSRTGKGYGKASCYGQVRAAHRVSYAIHKGEVSPFLVVRHTCDNPICVNPDHLVLGTHAENMQDMVDRGRSVKGRPSSNNLTTHNPELVVKVMRLNAEIGYSQARISRELGISAPVVSRIIKENL